MSYESSFKRKKACIEKGDAYDTMYPKVRTPIPLGYAGFYIVYYSMILIAIL
jgi:hypothetical protein